MRLKICIVQINKPSLHVNLEGYTLFPPLILSYKRQVHLKAYFLTLFPLLSTHFRVDSYTTKSRYAPDHLSSLLMEETSTMLTRNYWFLSLQVPMNQLSQLCVPFEQFGLSPKTWPPVLFVVLIFGGSLVPLWRQISRQEAHIHRQDAQINRQDALISRQDTHISRQEAQITRHDAQIAALREQIQQQNGNVPKQVYPRTELCDKLNELVAAVNSSISSVQAASNNGFLSVQEASRQALFTGWQTVPVCGRAHRDGFLLCTSFYNAEMVGFISGVQRCVDSCRDMQGKGQGYNAGLIPVMAGESYNIQGAEKVWFMGLRKFEFKHGKIVSPVVAVKFQ